MGGQSGSTTATVTVLFCDLVSSTERHARLGDDAADEFRRRFFNALRAAVAQHRGEEVKNLGDGLMVVFPSSAVDAIACALAMHENVTSLEPNDPVDLRIGISAGEAAHEGDDWFGTPVIEAARLCAMAEAGQTLAADVVRALVGSRGTYELSPFGSLQLKGLPLPVPTVEVRRRDPSEPSAADPEGGVPSPTPAPVAPFAVGGYASGPAEHRRVFVVVAVAIIVLLAGVAAFAMMGGEDDGRPSAEGEPDQPTTTVDEQVSGPTGSNEIGQLTEEGATFVLPSGEDLEVDFDAGAGERVGLRWTFEGSDEDEEQEVTFDIVAPDGSTAAGTEYVAYTSLGGPYFLPVAGTYTLQATSTPASDGAEVVVYLVPPDFRVDTYVGGPPVEVTTTVRGQRAVVEFEVTEEIPFRVTWSSPGDDDRYKFIRLYPQEGAEEALWEFDVLGVGTSDPVTVPPGVYHLEVDWSDFGTGSGTIEIFAT